MTESLPFSSESPTPSTDSLPPDPSPSLSLVVTSPTPMTPESPSTSSSEPKPSGAEQPPPSGPKKPFGPLVLGPASATERALIQGLTTAKIPQEHFPPELRNRIVKKGKKGEAGQIIVKKHTGVVDNTAKALTKRFEQNTLGRDDIIEKLEAVNAEGALTQEQSRVLELLKTSARSKGLAHILADAKSEPLSVMRAYARGCVVLGQVQAAIEAHSRMPALVKDIFRHAMDQTGVCSTCVGSGKVARNVGGSMESKICPACEGAGTTMISSKHKEWASKVALEMTGQIKGPSGPTVNVQQNVNVSPQAEGFMETLLKATDKVLYGSRPDIVDAEIVSQANS